jgi:opacity protein-like surface antigen
MSRALVFAAVALLVAGAQAVCAADAAPVAAAAKPPLLPGPIVEDEAGFKPIFDGRSLHGWDGDPRLWRAENGTIVGEFTEQNAQKEETFLIWRGGEPQDFELKGDYRVSDLGNSGFEYRSRQVEGSKWDLDGGYQMDIDGRQWGDRFNQRMMKKNGVDCPRVTGENVGQVIFALPGQISRLSEHQERHVLGNLGTCAAVTQSLDDGWNKVHLIIRGGWMIHIINGQVMSVVIDDDPARSRRGLLGLQLHGGGPMKIEYKNLRIKSLNLDQ